MMKRGRVARGSQIGTAKLNEEKVSEILRLLGEGRGQTSLARQFGITQQAIHLIASGERWSHVSGPRPTIKPKPKTSRFYGVTNKGWNRSTFLERLFTLPTSASK
jgi:hypothetical protein